MLDLYGALKYFRVRHHIIKFRFWPSAWSCKWMDVESTTQLPYPVFSVSVRTSWCSIIFIVFSDNYFEKTLCKRIFCFTYWFSKELENWTILSSCNHKNCMWISRSSLIFYMCRYIILHITWGEGIWIYGLFEKVEMPQLPSFMRSFFFFQIIGLRLLHMALWFSNTVSFNT